MLLLGNRKQQAGSFAIKPDLFRQTHFESFADVSRSKICRVLSQDDAFRKYC